MNIRKPAIMILSIFMGMLYSNQSLKIGFWTTWNIQCGVAMYSQHIVNALKAKKYDVKIYPHNLSVSELLKRIKIDKINVLNIQYERSIMPGLDKLIPTINAIKKQHVKVILTAHSESAAIKELYEHVDKLIYHKPSQYFPRSSKVHFLKMGVPVFDISTNNKEALKKKYRFKKDDVIISTIGFLTPHKAYPDILKKLTYWIKSNPSHKVQILAPYNTSSPNALKSSIQEHTQVNAVIAKHKISHQVVHVSRFMSQQELSERLYISNLGFLWMAKDTLGSSAACKEFITARLPVVITNSSHYHDLQEGTIKVPKQKDQFIATLLNNIKNPLLNNLRMDLALMYNKLNYNALINDYLKVFNS